VREGESFRGVRRCVFVESGMRLGVAVVCCGVQWYGFFGCGVLWGVAGVPCVKPLPMGSEGGGSELILAVRPYKCRGRGGGSLRDVCA